MPVSPSAQRMWVLERLAPQPALAVQTSLRLDGALDRSSLEAALAHLVARHDALRTRFATGARRQPTALVEDEAHLPLEVVDLASVAQHGQGAALLDATRKAVRAPFDLTRAPLAKALVFVLAPERHHLVLLVHHTMADGRSSSVLAEELAVAYGAIAKGTAPALPALDCTNAELAAAEWERLSADVGEDLVGWWRGYLTGAPARLALPTDRPRPAVQRHEGARASITLPADLGCLSGATLFDTLLAAWAVVLHRNGAGDDLVLGTHVARRQRPETEGVVGCLMNTVPLRVDVSGDPSYRQLLTRVAGSAKGALDHAELPFDVLVDRLRPSRDAGANPVFQAEYVWWGTPDLDESRAGVCFRLSPLDLGACASDVGLTVSPKGEDLVCRVDYDVDLFDPTTGERLLRHLRAVLESALAAPDEPVSVLPLVDDEERQRLLVTWNDTASRLPGGTVLDLIASRVVAQPEAMAVVSGEDRLTYADLDAAADHVAAGLQRRGARRGSIVGLSTERPLDAVVGMLGVLRAGAAFVPLDPESPPARRAALTEGLGLETILTGDDLVAVALDRDSPRPVSPHPDDLAYVVHTSGSTGEPKGVMVSHANLLSSTWAHLERNPEPMGGILLPHASTFDAFLGNVVWALAAGGTLLLPAPEERGDPERLLALVAAHRPSHAVILSSLWSALLQHADADELACLTTAVIGSEQCPRGVVDLHHRVLPGAALYNEYGPTECTMWCTAHRCEDEERWPVPIGKPIANASAYVLDAGERLAPAGVVGELCIGGAGVSHGYWADPVLTAERFVPDPYSNEPGARLYRTGDRARWLPDGVLQVLGRLDDQLNVRGFRIEPAEVEAALLRHGGVAEAAGGARAGPDGADRLVAWVVAGPGGVDADELRRHCRAELAPHLVPSVITMVERLPRRATGKVDRQALPAPEVDAGASGRMPTTPTERRLAELWQEVLGVSQVGATDDFFDLGGHSLLALQLFALMEERLGRDLPLATLFHAPTIEQLAVELDAGDDPGWSAAVPMGSEPPDTGTTPFFCVHGAAGNVLVFRELAMRLGTDRPFHALQSPSLDGTRFPFRRIEDMAASYVDELRAVQREGPWLLGGYSFGGIVAYEMARQLEAAGGEVGLVTLLDTVGPDWRERPAAGGLRHLIGRLRTEARLALGRPLPVTMRSYYVKGATRRVRARYTPRPYPGRITLFCRPEDRVTAEDRWSELAGGGLDVHVVEGTHDTMLEPPAVDALAARLGLLLADADRSSMMVTHDRAPVLPPPHPAHR